MELQNYLAQSAARIRARKERRYKAAPWLRPNKREVQVDVDCIGDVLMAAAQACADRLGGVEHTKAHESGTVTHAASSRVDSIVTGRVDEITGTIEIGGKVQGWRLIYYANNNSVGLLIHDDTVMEFCNWYGLRMWAGPKDDQKCIHVWEAEHDLKPDPNFTPPGQYVEGANGMKFWVITEANGHIVVWMNDRILFAISSNEISIYNAVQSAAKCEDWYPYHGCQCDECGGGE